MKAILIGLMALASLRSYAECIYELRYKKSTLSKSNIFYSHKCRDSKKMCKSSKKKLLHSFSLDRSKLKCHKVGDRDNYNPTIPNKRIKVRAKFRGDHAFYFIDINGSTIQEIKEECLKDIGLSKVERVDAIESYINGEYVVSETNSFWKSREAYCDEIIGAIDSVYRFRPFVFW